MNSYIKAFWQPIINGLQGLTEHPIVKTIIAGLLYVLSTFVHEDAIKILILLSLVLVDMGTGIWVALKTKTFTSTKFRNGIIKLLFYCIMIGAFHALGQISLVFAALTLDTLCLVYLAATEVVSIIENSSKVLGISIPTWLLSKVKGFLKTGDSGTPPAANP